jgi:hypothetical protein
MRANALARPEQPQFPLRSAAPASLRVLQIIADAARTAALAPSDRDALDVTGEALRRLAELARAEVLHG